MAVGVREIVPGLNNGSSEGNPGTVELTTGSGTLATDLLVLAHHAYGGPATAMLEPDANGAGWTLWGTGRNDATDNPHTKFWTKPAQAGAQVVTARHTGTGFSASQQHAHLFVCSGANLTTPVPTGGFAGATGFNSSQAAPSATGIADGVRVSSWISDDVVNYSSAMSGPTETDATSSTAYSGWETTAGGATGTETATIGSGKTYTATTLTIAPAADSTPEVTASIPLALAVGAVTQAQHDVAGSIPMAVAVSAVTQAQHDVAGSIPLGLAVGATSSVDHQATSSILLGLAVGAASAAQHDVAGPIPLALAVGAVAEQPGVSNVTASILLQVAIGAGTQTQHDATSSILLGLTVGATVTDPEPGRPVAPFPDPARPVEVFPGARLIAEFIASPRPVRSFSEVPE